MPLRTGARLGPYEVTSAIGAGGMGEVYRARDTKLHRDVAIKVLSELFAADAGRLARFDREAQALAALNHPNIAQIHGLVDLPPDSGSGRRAFVMELVEGEDLAARVARGPLPIGEALAIARQIAEGLDAAHERGIVHRDLKPANIRVREDGTIKVLDFGLASASAREESGGAVPGSPDLAHSPTFTSPGRVTEAGVILGTAAYMAPEQAKGKAVDKRADIWAFGVVLYEMLTGSAPFADETIGEVIAAILTREPGLERLPPGVPAEVRRLLERCLQKDPRRRLRDIGDAFLELDSVGGMSTVPLAPESTRRFGPRFLLAAVAVAVALTALGVTWLFRSPEVTAPPVRAAVLQGAGFHPYSTVAVSPDGGTLAFYRDRIVGGGDLFVQPLQAFAPRLLVEHGVISIRSSHRMGSRWGS